MWVAHIILEYTPISSNFQSPKYVIKPKDPQLVQIDVAIPGFLIGPPPPPKGTHNIALIDQQIDKILQSRGGGYSIKLKDQEELVQEPKPANLKEDFSIFVRPEFVESSGASSRRQSIVRVSTDQETTNVPKAMVLQRMTLNLLALLESHTGVLRPR